MKKDWSTVPSPKQSDSIQGPSLFCSELLPMIAFYPIIFLTPANILDSNQPPK